jgi:3-methyl-2-oxobutanoate hydroxymethyltransferase
VTEKLTVPALQAMKRQGRKIAAAVAWDTATARVLDGAGVDLVSVGDSVAVVLWGRESEGDVTLDELLVPCAAVARGVERALVSCDLPDPSVEAAARLRDEGGAGLVKVEGLGAVRAVAAAGIPVFAQLAGDGDPVEEAKRLEDAGAALLDFRHSGPERGRAVAAAVAIPVLGGLGGGPWLDGRVRAVHRLLGTAAAAYVDDVRAGRPVQGD